MNNDTPRTNASTGWGIGGLEVTPASFARELERELKHVRSERDQAQAKLALAADTIIESNYYGGFAAPRGAAKVLHAVLNLVLPNDEDDSRRARSARS